MKLRVTPPAAREINKILAYVASDSASAAASVGLRIDEVMATLTQNPGLGRRTDRPGIRFVNAHPYPYLIYFRTSATELQVIAVRHGARNPRSMPARPR